MNRFLLPRVRTPVAAPPDVATPDTIGPAVRGDDLSRQLQRSYGNGAVAALLERDEPRQLPSTPFRDLLRRGEEPAPAPMRPDTKPVSETAVIELDGREPTQPEVPSSKPAAKTGDKGSKDDETKPSADKGEAADDKGKGAGGEEKEADEDGKRPADVLADAAGGQGPGATGQPEAPGAPGGEGDPLGAWRARVATASRSVKTSKLEGAPHVSVVTAAGGAAVGRQAVRRQAIAPSAKKAIPPPPKTNLPPPVPPEPDPVPAATQAVVDTSDKRLAPQTFPALEQSLGKEIPRTGDLGALSAREGYEPSPAPEPDTAQKDAAATDKDKDPNRKKAADIKTKTEKPPEVAPKQARGDAVTLTDQGAPPSTPLSGAQKTNVAQVLARILADPDSEVERMLTAARSAAYPGEVLNVVYPDIGTDKKAQLTTDLQAEMDRVRSESGISEAELRSEVDARKKELAAQKAAADKQVADAGATQKSGVQNEGQQNADAVAGTAQTMHKQVEATVEASAGENDPQAVTMKRDRLIGTITRKVADQIAQYRRALDTRTKAIDQTAQGQAAAYRDTGEREARQLVNQADEAGKNAALLEAAKRRAWGQEHVNAVAKMALDFKRSAGTQSSGYQTAVGAAGGTARDLIRAWSEQNIGEGRSWWETLLDLFRDWSSQATANTEAWETATAQETRDAITGDFAELDKLVAMARQGVDLGAMAKNGELSQQQLAVLTAFFMGPEKMNPIAAVAATLRVRIQMRWQPRLVEGFEKTLLEKPDADWKKLESIGATQRGGFNASVIVTQAYEAMHGGLTGWGTDEEKLFAALNGLTKLQAAAVKKCYATRHPGRDLDADIKDELSGHERERAQAQLSGDQAKADAAALREAMHGGLTGWGTDETAIHNLLRGKSEAERQAIMAVYQQEYHIDLKADLKSEMEDDDLDRADAYLQGNTGLGDAIALHDAMKGGWFFGLGTDEKGIEKVYTDIRTEVAAQAQREGWTTARMEAEIRRRSGEVENKFNDKYGGEFKEPGEPSALRAAFKSELSGADLELANALADADETRADAARMRVEMHSFVTDDDAVNEILNKQYERALDDLKRDEWPKIEDELKKRALADENAKPPRRWTPEDWARERRLRLRTLEGQAEKASAGYMKRLESAYDEKAWGKGALRLAIAFNTSGMDQDQAVALLDAGYLTDVQKIDFSVQGLGTNEALLEKTLKGKTPDEVDKIRKDWEKKHPGENFNARILEETGIWGIGGGREKFDFGLLLEGEPESLEGKIARERKRVQFELDHETPDGHALSGEERRAMLAELADLEEAHAKLIDPKTTVDQKALLYGQFERRTEGVQASVTAYRTQVDALADTAANIAGAVVALTLVVAGIVGGIFTGGATTVAVFALLTSLAATAASMAAKAMIKGSNYSADEIAVDVAVGVVDAAVSVATAGLGSKLLAMKGLAQLATKGKAAQFVAHLIAEGVENMVQSAAPSVTRNLLNDKIWESTDSFGQFSESTITETATGTAMGLGMGKVMEHGLGKLLPGPKPGELGADVITGDVLARRGTPEQRLALFHEFKQSNPDASMSDFLKELDAGVLKQSQLDDALKKLQREMRTELLAGLPPDVRGQFADTPIKMMSDADFASFTKSASGNAVVIIDGGKMTVVLREGAPLSVLREEGVHLHQSLDPKARAKMSELDESRLAHWDEMSLDEQFRTYKTKLELEIDGQERLLQGLRHSMEKADATTMKALAQQIEQAEQTLRNLNGRMVEVDGIAPDARVKMASGAEPKPHYLEQPPRLFGKKAPETQSIETGLKGDQEAIADAKKTLENLRRRVKFDDPATGFGKDFRAAVDKLSSSPEDLALFMRSVDGILKEGKHAPEVVEGLLRAAAKSDNPTAFAVGAHELLSADLKSGTIGHISEMLVKLPPGEASDVLGVLLKAKQLGTDFATADVLPLMKEMKALAAKHTPPATQFEAALRNAAADLSGGRANQLHATLDLIEQFPKKYSLDNPPVLPEGYEFRRSNKEWIARPVDGLADVEGPNMKFDEHGDLQPQKSTRTTFAQRKQEWHDELPPLEDGKHPLVKAEVEKLPKKPPNDNGFTDQDLAIAKRWGDTIEALNKHLGPDEAKKFVDDLFGGLKPPITETQYDAFRHSIRKKMVDHAIWEIPPVGNQPGKPRPFDEQWKIMLGDATLKPGEPTPLLNLQPDSASKGALFTEFREARMSMDPSLEAGVSGIKHIEAPHKIGEGPRMVDGQVDVTKTIALGTADNPDLAMETGRYAAEDKAGKGAYDPDQAEKYSTDLEQKGGMVVGGTQVKGVIYTFDSAAAAQAAALDMAGPPPLSNKIFVAYFGTDGKLNFVRRSFPK